MVERDYGGETILLSRIRSREENFSKVVLRRLQTVATVYEGQRKVSRERNIYLSARIGAVTY